MPMHRRRFLTGAMTSGLLASGGFAAGADHDPCDANGAETPASKKLSILMLGGTGFLGPSIVSEFLDRGHQVTLFNRGITNPHLFNYLERLRGDREDPNGEGLGALKGRQWDVVVDTWQKGAKCVEDTARYLSGQVANYFYISTIGVYASYNAVGTDEMAPLVNTSGRPISRQTDQSYRMRKTQSEEMLAAHFDGPVTNFRSHGMRDDRIPAPGDEPYWPVRIWRGGNVLTPEDGSSSGQFTDVTSLCSFIRHCAERSIAGNFNVAHRSFRLDEYLSAIQRVTQSDAHFVWTPREKLAEFGVEPYRNLPMWRPEPAGFYHFSVEKAIKAGLRNRPLESSAASMLEGYFTRYPGDEFRFEDFPDYGTLATAREAEILQALGVR